jgi:hypothetical protein
MEVHRPESASRPVPAGQALQASALSSPRPMRRVEPARSSASASFRPPGADAAQRVLAQAGELVEALQDGLKRNSRGAKSEAEDRRLLASASSSLRDLVAHARQGETPLFGPRPVDVPQLRAYQPDEDPRWWLDAVGHVRDGLILLAEEMESAEGGEGLEFGERVRALDTALRNRLQEPPGSGLDLTA